MDIFIVSFYTTGVKIKNALYQYLQEWAVHMFSR